MRSLHMMLCALAIAGAMTLAGQDKFQWPGGARAAVSLTYDDGVDVHLDIVVPDLEAHNFRGTFYVPGFSRSLANRMEEWRAIARRGHELGNHSVFHPCLRVDAKGRERTFVTPERNLDNYTVPRIISELAANNTLLYAVDGKRVRSYAYTCCDVTAGSVPYIDALRPLFPAARGGDNEAEIADPRTLDVHQVASWMVAKVSGEAMINFVKKAVDAGGLAVVMFHGVGGGHGINVEREAHQQLLAWLDQNRKTVWTGTFLNVIEHVITERQRLGWRNPRP